MTPRPFPLNTTLPWWMWTKTFHSSSSGVKTSRSLVQTSVIFFSEKHIPKKEAATNLSVSDRGGLGMEQSRALWAWPNKSVHFASFQMCCSRAPSVHPEGLFTSAIAQPSSVWSRVKLSLLGHICVLSPAMPPLCDPLKAWDGPWLRLESGMLLTLLELPQSDSVAVSIIPHLHFEAVFFFFFSAPGEPRPVLLPRC